MTCKLSFLLLFPILFCSCIEEVYWTNPISETENARVDDRLFGTWRLESMRIYLHIGKGDGNTMRFIGQELDGEARSLSGIMHISRLGERSFLNIKLFDSDVQGVPEIYLIVEYEMTNRENLIVYFPRHDYVKEAIEDKMLSGETMSGTSGGVIVRSSSQEIRAFVGNSPHWIFSDIMKFKRLKL